MPTAINDPDDPRIEPYRTIRDRDLAGRDRLFMVEGEVVLRVLVRQRRFPIRSILLAENRIEPLRDVIETLPSDVAIYSASRTVMDAIVGFPIHRGVLAVAERIDAPPIADFLASLPSNALVLGLVGLANHDNVGGIFRNAAAFGAAAVMLDQTSCDPLYRKAIRVSVGGVLTVPFTRSLSADAMVTDLQDCGFEVLSLSPSGHETLAAVKPASRTAILLGAEGPGLPPALLARTRVISIPMRSGFDSLNVATASGIALHHLSQG